MTKTPALAIAATEPFSDDASLAAAIAALPILDEEEEEEEEEEGEEQPSDDDANEGDDNDPVDDDPEEVQGDDKPKPAKRSKQKVTGDDAAAELQRQLDELRGRYEGVDPEQARKDAKELRESKAAARKAEKEAAEKDGNWERLREIQNEEVEAERQRLNGEVESERTRATEAEQMIEALRIENAFTGSTFLNQKTVLPTSHAQRLFKDNVELQDGEIVVFDKPKGEKRRAPIVDAKGEPKPFDEAMAYLIENDPARDTFLRSTVKPGGNSSGIEGKEDAPARSSQDKIAKGMEQFLKS